MDQEKQSRLAMSAAIGATLLLAGCAGGGSPPTAELAAAQTRLSDAEHAGALQYAPVPYNSARQHLAQAQAAVQHEDYQAAARFAGEAEADAHLAQVTTQAAHAEQAAAAVKQDTSTLRQETTPPATQ